MAARKKKATATKKPQTVQSTPIKVRFGGRNGLGPTHRFTTEAKAKAKIVDELQEVLAWCQRFNRRGVEAVAETIDKVATITFHLSPQRLECLFDETYDMSLVIEFWRTNE